MYPLMFVLVMVMMSWILRSGKGDGAPRARPALLISTSMWETWETMLEMAVERAAWSWTSTEVVNTLRSVWASWRSLARVVSWSEERAKRISVACSEARRRAMAAPMPIEAPVIRTFWRLRDIVVGMRRWKGLWICQF